MRPENNRWMLSKEEHILYSAEKIFSENGFEGASTRKIAEAAGVNISMISYYFGSKEKLFEKLFELRHQESIRFITEIGENQDLNEWEKLAAIVDRFAERVYKLNAYYRIMQIEQLTNKNTSIATTIRHYKTIFLRSYEEILKAGFRKGIFRKNPELELVHATISGTIMQAISNLPVYRSFDGIEIDEDDAYLEQIKTHLKNILKYLLGYEKH